MRCDNCDRQMDYTFYIDDKFWRKVVGEENFRKNVGRWCSHCVLQKLGGLYWYIVFNEPLDRSEKSPPPSPHTYVEQKDGKLKCKCGSEAPRNKI